jgi:GLPGLI family protein
MKRYTLLFFVVLSFYGLNLNAQHVHFVNSGIVEFEKTVNMFAILKKKAETIKSSNVRLAYERYKQNEPQFLKLKSVLTFKDSKTFYRPGQNDQIFESSVFGADPRYGLNSLIFNDFSEGYFEEQKNVLNEQFLIRDSVLKVKWKLTDEVRDIAGYSCRRANGLILDSTYVVAFFTEKILSQGGPELFSGLPGMILGVALPHDNINWFATKVTEVKFESKIFDRQLKGRPANLKVIESTVNSVKVSNMAELKWFLLL